MSLLLDVLRRAEEGRQAPEAGTASPLGRMELEPIAEAPQRASASAASSVRAPIGPDTNPGPSTVTEPAALDPHSPARAERPAWSLIGSSALATGLVVAACLWPFAEPTPLAYAGPPAPAPAPLADPAPAPELRLAPEAPSDSTIRPAITYAAADARPPSRRPVPKPTVRETALLAEEPVHFRPGSANTTPIRPLVLQAHDAYGAGDLQLAGQRYLEALTTDPNDLDALDGLGAIALRENRPEEAEVFFRKALLVAPHDPVALAGLSRLSAADPIQTETRLKNSLAAQPDTLAPRLALADNLARQQRWAEAQQAWFQAHSLAPGDPDIAYNLAVSLDHLGQGRPAASFYRKALQLAERQPARFSRTQCDSRLKALTALTAAQPAR